MASHAPPPGRGVPGRHGVNDAGVGAVGVGPHLGRQLGGIAHVEQRHLVEQVDEQLERRVAGRGGERAVQRPGVADVARLLLVDDLAQVLDVVGGESLDGHVDDELLEDHPGLEDLVESGVDAVQVQQGGVDDRLDRRLGDHEAAARATPHPGHVLVLDQAYGLPEDRRGSRRTARAARVRTRGPRRRASRRRSRRRRSDRRPADASLPSGEVSRRPLPRDGDVSERGGIAPGMYTGVMWTPGHARAS